jgi:hypothetical protein
MSEHENEDREPKAKPDPTDNVRLFLDNAVDRIDDLRNLGNERIEELMAASKDKRDVVFEINNKRLSDLRIADNNFSKMESFYLRELALSESKRIDAVIAVGVTAAAVTSERQSEAATTLALQVAQSADTLRNLVAQTASSQALLLSQFQGSVDKRLVDLERAQNVSTGRQGVSDPMMSELITEVKRQGEKSATTGGSKEGSDATTSKIIAAVAVGIAVMTFWNSNQNKKEVVYVNTPQAAASPPESTTIVIPSAKGTK